ncbi:mechanosensitive ion channel family protein [Patiriisocius sp. Uisw_017]|jgi:small conductance mechanosensitive channel|uniref:mechanosensitive ion channel family protein n=1 Tax=Patiriisocius sp. Uisw_017 TaxID=3230968 RepID=UPI0039EA56CE
MEFMVEYGSKIIWAILIWIIGSWLVKKITSTVERLMEKKKHGLILQKILCNLIGWGL